MNKHTNIQASTNLRYSFQTSEKKNNFSTLSNFVSLKVSLNLHCCLNMDHDYQWMKKLTRHILTNIFITKCYQVDQTLPKCFIYVLFHKGFFLSFMNALLQKYANKDIGKNEIEFQIDIKYTSVVTCVSVCVCVSS